MENNQRKKRLPAYWNTKWYKDTFRGIYLEQERINQTVGGQLVNLLDFYGTLSTVAEPIIQFFSAQVI